jgi:PDZ domain-containing secreted protein
MSYSKDSEKAKIFYKENEAKIKDLFTGDLYTLEFDNDKLGVLFDQLASTDLVLINKNKQIYGVAMRINFSKHMHDKVTIRYKRHSGTKTEYEKTVQSFKNKSFNSVYGIQCNSQNNVLVKSIQYDRLDLFRKIEMNKEKILSENLKRAYEKCRVKYNSYLEFNFDFFKENNIKHKILTY